MNSVWGREFEGGGEDNSMFVCLGSRTASAVALISANQSPGFCQMDQTE